LTALLDYQILRVPKNLGLPCQFAVIIIVKSKVIKLYILSCVTRASKRPMQTWPNSFTVVASSYVDLRTNEMQPNDGRHEVGHLKTLFCLKKSDWHRSGGRGWGYHGRCKARGPLGSVEEVVQVFFGGRGRGWIWTRRNLAKVLTCNLEFSYKYYALMGRICHLLATVSSGSITNSSNNKHNNLSTWWR